MKLLSRAATLVGLAAGGVAAARAVASLTPSERAALAQLLGAGADLAKSQAGAVGARARGLLGGTPALPPARRDRYRAGPLHVEGESPLPVGLRGPHGEPPASESSERFAHASQAFGRRFELALDTEQLRKNLLYYQRTWRSQRDAAVAELERDDPEHEDFDVLRRRFAAIKDEVIANLDEYVVAFKRSAERNGVVVYEAKDAADANRYVAELAKSRGIQRAIKSKSMVSEEIHLNHALEEAGLHVVETDFGEWIAQLDHDRPGHMVSPIAHKNRHEVGDAISQATGVHTTGDDIPEMAAIARAQLRKDFLAGQLGISGANALIASTGAIMLITNEGNGRLTTSLPTVHVAICGPEKLVPDMAAAMLQVRLLGRSGTGQTQTVYTTFKNGPDRPGAEMHVVLLDNGRSRMRADLELAEALRCIRCGACANVCPPYGVLGGHTFGYVYTGAIGLVTTPFHHGLENAADPQSLCLQCNACATVCPVAIPLPRQILDVRRHVADAAGQPPYKRAMLAVWRQPRLFDRLGRVGALLAAPFATEHPIHGRMLSRLPLPADQAWRTPPAPAPAPARDVLRIPEPAREGPLARGGARGLTVAYFIQCLTDRLFPDMAQATVDVLAACGARVVVPREQHCCGLIADDAGDRAGAIALAKATIEALEHTAAHWIVTGGTSCAIAVLHDYAHLFRDQPGWEERARRLAARTLDLTSFLDRVAQLPAGALANENRYAVTYHNFCGANNVLKLQDEPRRIIRDVLGLELREMAEAGVCCGFGGSFSTDHPRVSRLVAERKLANVDATGASIVVTDNPGCIVHLRGALHASNRPVRVIHMAELIAERLREVTR